MKRSLSLRTILAVIGLTAGMPQVQAQPLINATGTITQLWLSGGGNYAFRVSLSLNGIDQLGMCHNDFAYVNTSDDNYQAKVATLLTAYSMKKTVILLYKLDSNQFCQILDFNVQG